MYVFYRELTIDEGTEVVAQPRHSRLIVGKEASMPKGLPLFMGLIEKGEQIKCWNCGCVADRWIFGQHRNEQGRKPTMNLYAARYPKPTRKNPRPPHQLVMMTRDHIIPRAEGGVDDVENLRAGCETCNHDRGSNMNKADIAFMEANPHLVDDMRKRDAQSIKQKHEQKIAECNARKKV